MAEEQFTVKRISELPDATYAGTTYVPVDDGTTTGKLALKDIVPDGSTSEKGIVQLEDSHASTSTTNAATPKNVKEAYDLANGKYSKPSGGIPSTDLASGVQGSLTKADTAMQSAPIDGFYVCRGNDWVKVYDLQVIVIQGYPVSDPDVYEKIGSFNGNLYSYVQVSIEGTATVGLYDYNELEYAEEITLTDNIQGVQLQTSGIFEVHAKGSDGIVTVIVSADPLDSGSING